MHRYAVRPAAIGGVKLTDSPALRQSWMRRIARHAFQFAAALAVVAAYLALCAVLEV